MANSDEYCKLMCLDCEKDVCYIDIEDTVPSILCWECYSKLQLMEDMSDGQ